MSFEREMRAAELKITQASEKTVRATALQLFTQVIERTPVDTGAARGNWRTAINQAPIGTVERTGSGPALSEVNLAAARFTLADTIYLANNLPYIERLESGDWSRQAPQGMVAVTVNEFERVIDSEARRNRV
jgi:hypothetical protein